MSKKANPAVVGGFVLGAVALVVAAVAVLGSGDLFHSRPRAVSYFEGSVRGLSVGAPVTWQGVPIGSVTEIRMELDPDKHTIRIPVFMEFQPERVNIVGVNAQQGEIRIKDLVYKGLRAQLQLQSMVTGQLYIELAMRPETPIQGIGPAYFLVPEIPTVKSELDVLKESIERLPLRELGETAMVTLTHIDQLVTSPEAKTLIVQLAASAQELAQTLQAVHAQVNPVAGSVIGGANALKDSLAGMQSVEGDVKSTLGEFQRTASATNAELARMAADVHNALASADQSFRDAQAALTSANSLIAPNTPQRADLDQIVRNLTYASQSLRSLSEKLERNPNALLMGNK